MKLFIHRKDLRIQDLVGFNYIHEAEAQSVHLLIIDPFLLRKGREKEHSGVNFLRHVHRLQKLYQSQHKTLHIVYGQPEVVLDHVLNKLDIDEVVTHRDFTPYAKDRDRKLKAVADQANVAFTLLVDHMLIDVEQFSDFTGKDGFYKVFAPFHRKWLDFLDQHPNHASSISLKDLNISRAELTLPAEFELPFALEEYEPAEDPEPILQTFIKSKMVNYGEERDYYSIDPSSDLNPHVTIGAISIRQMLDDALRAQGHEEWVRQISFRDFYLYQAIYDEHYFKYEHKYDLSELTDQHFEAWYKGETGIPVIDASMRQLNETGRIHNRLRILSGMFLTKNLQCPFTLGEQYFRRKLLDYDNVINRGNWMWCASLGINSAPYFRVVNPVTQSTKYDPEGDYIREWMPELNDLSAKEIHQPQKNAIVDLKISRASAIETYKKIVNNV